MLLEGQNGTGAGLKLDAASLDCHVELFGGREALAFLCPSGYCGAIHRVFCPKTLGRRWCWFQDRAGVLSHGRDLV